MIALLLAAAPNIASATTLFYEDFSDDSGGWVLGPEWQIGSATASSGHTWGNPDPSEDSTPTSDNGVAGVVIGGNASTFDIHSYYFLESPAIDTTSESTVLLEYARWLNSDYTPFMHNKVEVYDGTAWQLVWQSGPSPGVTDSAWTPQSFDITPHSNANLRVRFGFNIDSSNAHTVGGWNVDDVRIVPEPASAALILFAAAATALRPRATRRTRDVGDFRLSVLRR